MTKGQQIVSELPDIHSTQTGMKRLVGAFPVSLAKRIDTAIAEAVKQEHEACLRIVRSNSKQRTSAPEIHTCAMIEMQIRAMEPNNNTEAKIPSCPNIVVQREGTSFKLTHPPLSDMGARVEPETKIDTLEERAMSIFVSSGVASKYEVVAKDVAIAFAADYRKLIAECADAVTKQTETTTESSIPEEVSSVGDRILFHAKLRVLSLFPSIDKKVWCEHIKLVGISALNISAWVSDFDGNGHEQSVPDCFGQCPIAGCGKPRPQ